MRIVSKPFNLSPGFEAEGKTITQATVRLLTNNEEESAGTAIRGKQLAELKAAEAQLRQVNAAAAINPGAPPPELDLVQKITINQRAENRYLLMLQTESFITDEGVVIADRDKIERYFGLLIKTDWDAIRLEQEALENSLRRDDFRTRYKCPNCETVVDPKSAEAVAIAQRTISI